MFKNSPKLKAYSRDDLVLTLICDNDFVVKNGPAARTAIFNGKIRGIYHNLVDRVRLLL